MPPENFGLLSNNEETIEKRAEQGKKHEKMCFAPWLAVCQ
jgi:hypothetical protein